MNYISSQNVIENFTSFIIYPNSNTITSEIRKCMNRCLTYTNRKDFLYVSQCFCHNSLDTLNRELSELVNSLDKTTLGFKSNIKFNFYEKTYMGSEYYQVFENVNNKTECLNECLLDSFSQCIGVSFNQTHCLLYKDLVYIKQQNRAFDSYVLPHSVGFTINSHGLKSHYVNLTERSLDACVVKCQADEKCDYITYKQYKQISDLTCKFSSSRQFNNLKRDGDLDVDNNEDLYQDENSKILILDAKQKQFNLYVLNSTKFVATLNRLSSPTWDSSFYTQNAIQCWYHCDVDTECQAASYSKQTNKHVESFSNCFLFKKDDVLQVDSTANLTQWQSYINFKDFERMLNADLSAQWTKKFYLYSDLKLKNLTDCLEMCASMDFCISVEYNKVRMLCTLYKGVPANDNDASTLNHQTTLFLINTNRGENQKIFAFIKFNRITNFNLYF